MSVEITVGELLQATPVLARLLDRSTTPRLALALRRVVRAVATASEDITEEERRILRDCGAVEGVHGFVAHDTDPHRLAFVTAGDEDEAVRRQRELYRTTLTLDVAPISAKALEQAGAHLSGRDALILGALLEDDLPQTEE